jgi:WD40 repeat protein
MTVPSGPADQLAFSPDGRRLVSADTQSLQLWDVDSGQPLGGPLTAEGRPIVGVAFSGDGRRLIAATDTATVWSWPAAATPQMLCDKLTTNMNRGQWRDWISPDTGYRELCPGLPVAAG